MPCDAAAAAAEDDCGWGLEAVGALVLELELEVELGKGRIGRVVGRSDWLSGKSRRNL